MNDIQFTLSGNVVDGNAADNLCVKAFHLLKKDHPELPCIKMHLHKTIPMGAGLGGGSADAAFALQLINTKYKLNLSDTTLSDYALQLGSDCPFFIINKPCIATGRGEIIEEIDLDLSGQTIVIINPGIHINTGWAFSQLSVKENIAASLDPANKTTWVNDFEAVVFEQYPEVKLIKDSLYNAGASFASMSGSGSTVYGLFDKIDPVIPLFPDNYYIKTLRL